jgi:hypothetical protein
VELVDEPVGEQRANERTAPADIQGPRDAPLRLVQLGASITPSRVMNSCTAILPMIVSFQSVAELCLFGSLDRDGAGRGDVSSEDGWRTPPSVRASARSGRLCAFYAGVGESGRDLERDTTGRRRHSKEVTMDCFTSNRRWTHVALAATLLVAALLAAAASSAAPAAACSFCGKNLVQNPGAESGRGLTAAGASGSVPHWTNTQGQFSAAAYTGFGVGWFSASSKGPADKGKNYFFGGTTPAATSAKATIGTQTIKLPAGAAGHKATLSGWLGNYGANTASVRATFTDASGKSLTGIRIGPDSTIGSYDMAPRTRAGTVPAGATGVTVTITFTDHANYNLAGADDVSLVLA